MALIGDAKQPTGEGKSDLVETGLTGPAAIALTLNHREPTRSLTESLMPDVVAPAHQNDRSYVRELSGPTFNSLCDNSAMVGGRLHEGPQKATKLSKLEGRRLPEDGRLPGTIRYKYNLAHSHSLAICQLMEANSN